MPTLSLERPPLVEYQRSFLYNPQRFTVTEAATKVGKTFSHSWWLFEQSHSPVDDGDEYLWLAPTYAQAAMVFDEVVRRVAHTGAYKVNHSALTITNPNGGILRYRTAEKPDNLYGPSNIRAIVGDEFTRWRPLVWPVVRSLATAKRCPVKLIGNFIGDSNWGHRLAIDNASDPDWVYFKITAQQAVNAGIMASEELESARRSLPPAVFAALYMCEGSAHPLQMMDADAIADLWTNSAERGDRYMVVDVAGEGQDKTTVTVWDGLHIDYIYTEDKSKGPDLVATIDALAKSEGVGRSRIVVDCDGIGGMGVADYLVGCVRFHGGGAVVPQQGDKRVNFANLRAQCYYKLAELVNERAVSIDPDCSEYASTINTELEYVRRKDDITANKLGVMPKDKVKEGLGRSPDYADNLMMRMVLELRGAPLAVDLLAKKGGELRKARRREEIKRYYKYR